MAYAPNTFPELIARANNLPRTYYGGMSGYGINDYVKETPFHLEGQNWAKKYVADRARINKRNQLVHSIGGYRNQIPKPQPTGAYLRPLTTSGNGIYGDRSKISGGFRTRAGVEYGKELLMKRGQQLAEMDALQEENLPLVEEPVEAPVEEIEAQAESPDETAFALLLSEIESTTSGAQEVGDINLGEIRKLYGLARKIVLNLPRGQLEEYYERINNLIGDLNTMFEEAQERAERGASQKLNAAFGSLLRVRALFRVSIASINKSPKERKQFVQQFSTEIVRKKNPRVIDNNLTKALTNLEKIPNYVEATQELTGEEQALRQPPRLEFGDDYEYEGLFEGEGKSKLKGGMDRKYADSDDEDLPRRRRGAVDEERGQAEVNSDYESDGEELTFDELPPEAIQGMFNVAVRGALPQAPAQGAQGAEEGVVLPAGEAERQAVAPDMRRAVFVPDVDEDEAPAVENTEVGFRMPEIQPQGESKVGEEIARQRWEEEQRQTRVQELMAQEQAEEEEEGRDDGMNDQRFQEQADGTQFLFGVRIPYRPRRGRDLQRRGFN